MKEVGKKPALTAVIFAILLVALNLRPAISSIGPMLEPIRTDLALTNGQVSLLTAVPVLCMGVFAPFAIVFNRRFGLKRSIGFLLAAIGVFTLGRGFWPSYFNLLLSSFFIGIAIAIIGPMLSAMIKRDFPTRTASLIGVYSFGMGLGATLAAGLTGVVYAASGWPAGLAIWSGLAIAALIIWLRMPEANGKGQQAMPDDPLPISESPWKNLKAWYMLLFFGFQSAFFFSMLTWLAPIAIDKGLSVLSAGAVVTVMTAVQIVCNISIPLLFSRYPNRFLWVLAVLAFGTAGILLLMVAGAWSVWLAAALIGVALGGLFPIALLLPLDATASADEANSWAAMTQSGGYLISAFMPFIIGVVYDRTGNHDATLWMFLAFVLFMILFAYLLNRKP
ncbi:CynX/NimT family MFS transporter [Planococcus maitriensis]|uniref:MFS transporter n=1 Tax=Planococcus maitriensis TaxID=221799 RepID=A0A365KBV7_9BACL|nr:MFS transporter [Planococcus maitriensis]RAZ70269.1 MFS transporter [Planococcus maitriensis]